MDFRTLIGPRALADILEEKGLVVVDCRFDLAQPEKGRDAWLSEHIPGAVYAHLDHELSGRISSSSGRHPLPKPEEMVRRFGAMGIGDGSQVVVYDDAGGAIAARAWWLLRWLGHERAAVLDGGLTAWKAAGLPLRSGIETNAPRTFAGRQTPGLVLELDELTEDADRVVKARLIDVRDAARFRGEHEPIDAVAGHIPGTRNLYFGSTLCEDGTLRAREDIRELLARALDGDLETPWSVMCGSGVTACQLALAAEHAGVRPPRVYVGSFSEWIRDPSRRVATGADQG